MPESSIIIIVGITGDLSRRYLLPALGEMAFAGVFSKPFRIVGITRQEHMNLDELLSGIANAEHIRPHIELFSMSLVDDAEYKILSSKLSAIEVDFGGGAQRLWYLAVPPKTAWPIIEHLGVSGLSKAPHTKLLLEKPFGIDEESARELITHVEKSFTEQQVYRIDHYLAKETVQNIVVFRRDNPLFEQTWNGDFIERVDILVSEKIGIEGRAAFYEQTGALRDVVQSHLLQLAALTLMELPEDGEWARIPEARRKILSTLAVAPERARRGQYAGYRDEVGNPGSMVETFASLTLVSSEPRWRDVPIRLTTGKALGERKMEIVTTYRHTAATEGNRLSIRIQPDESIEFCINAKKPGYEQATERIPLTFTYADHFGALSGAYERVFLDALHGNHALFVGSEEVLESWRIIDAARKIFESTPGNLLIHERGESPERILSMDASGSMRK
ncbi:MAG: glucose-6-phosphate dehydrogenase [Minisyncoccia bacterium]